MRPIALFRYVLLLLVVFFAVGTAQADERLFARMSTDEGEILLVLYPELAPHHVASFVHLSRSGFYDGTRFHRIVPGFVIQGGDPNSKNDDPRDDGTGGPMMSDVLNQDEQELVAQVNRMLESKGYVGLDGPANLKAEFSKTAKHVTGSLSMARGRDVDSAGSQFFICVAPTPQLDGQYTLFGQVVMGQEVADTIVNAEKNAAAGRDAPANPVAIKKISIVEGTANLTAAEKAAWDALPAELQNIN